MCGHAVSLCVSPNHSNLLIKFNSSLTEEQQVSKVPRHLMEISWQAWGKSNALQQGASSCWTPESPGLGEKTVLDAPPAAKACWGGDYALLTIKQSY